MILEIDIGNTFAKWRMMDGQSVMARGKASSKNLLQDAVFATRVLAANAVHRVRLAAVIATADTAQVSRELSSLLGIEVELARTSSRQAGLVNSYQNPSSMGVDRWLAMLAAFQKVKAGGSQTGCLVVSCGTAVTIDSICQDGRHEGGYILPGLHLMRESLLAGTGRIQFKAGDFAESRRWGTSTAAAVEQGAVHALASAIEQACSEHIRSRGGCVMYLTGGDAMRMFRQLHLDMSAVSCHHVEDLVLDGLQYALP
jgi:type III pantothenate kinase